MDVVVAVAAAAAPAASGRRPLAVSRLPSSSPPRPPVVEWTPPIRQVSASPTSGADTQKPQVVALAATGPSSGARRELNWTACARPAQQVAHWRAHRRDHRTTATATQWPHQMGDTDSLSLFFAQLGNSFGRRRQQRQQQVFVGATAAVVVRLAIPAIQLGADADADTQSRQGRRRRRRSAKPHLAKGGGLIPVCGLFRRLQPASQPSN